MSNLNRAITDRVETLRSYDSVTRELSTPENGGSNYFDVIAFRSFYEKFNTPDLESFEVLVRYFLSLVIYQVSGTGKEFRKYVVSKFNRC